MKLGIFTGARSEYGLMRKLIKTLIEDSIFDVSLLVGGLHLLDSFGNSVKEIEADNVPVSAFLDFFDDDKAPTHKNFINAIKQAAITLEANKYDALFIIGDRVEAYAVALAAHFTRTPVVHSGGGTLTKGAFDNIYRYNISNLAYIHFATSKGNYKRLLNLPIIQTEKTYFSGSVAIDSINDFRKKPISIASVVSDIAPKNFVLMTFHPATNANEPTANILKQTVHYLLSKGTHVLITYPNNDPGFEPILEEILAVENINSVFVRKSLGALGYYAALNDCLFVIGNSSSGIIEAPYFHKQVINIGSRQEGREKDTGVIDVDASWEQVEAVLENGFELKWPLIKNSNIYGEGRSVQKIISALKKEFSGALNNKSEENQIV